jgi:predicted alpha/beta-hydrolase family hydrolase
MARTNELTISVPGGEVSATLDGPSDAETMLVLAPGAGAPRHHPFMADVAGKLADRGLRIGRFDFLYAMAGRKAPDRQPVLEETYRAVAEHLRAAESPQRFFIGGKSMGGRIASTIAAGEDPADVDGLVFLGYPLHPPGRPERIRDAHLYEVRTPMLFVEGTRDPFCPLETLGQVLEKVTAPTELSVIDDGDHSFKVRKSSGRSSEDALQEVVDAVATWIDLRRRK